MDIKRHQSGPLVTLRLTGRLDASWCAHLEASLNDTVRGGEHRLHLDMAEVSYISSAGLRVLLGCYKRLKAIQGQFGVVQPSAAVRKVLELSGLDRLIITGMAVLPSTDPAGQEHRTHNACYHLISLGIGGMKLEVIGESTSWHQGATQAAETRRFEADTVAIGIGALGSADDAMTTYGEFLATCGMAAFQPSNSPGRPDFMVSEGALVPEGQLMLGLLAKGSFNSLVRFEADPLARTIGLTDLAQVALDYSAADSAVFVAIAETAGLVGASLRQSPALPAKGGEQRLGYPELRDWLSFAGERVHRDSTALLVGIVSRPGSIMDPLLRPQGRKTDLLSHVHAVAFPYRPLKKGPVELHASIAELFDGHSLQAVLHLLSDHRDYSGVGESEFYRGALWIAPIIS
jgi:anti-anti-sigma factor